MPLELVVEFPHETNILVCKIKYTSTSYYNIINTLIERIMLMNGLVNGVST